MRLQLLLLLLHHFHPHMRLPCLEPLCCCDHGQFRLPHSRSLCFRSSSSGLYYFHTMKKRKKEVLLMHINKQGDFVRVWGQFDPGGAGKLHQCQLLPLLRSPRKRKQLENIFSGIFRLLLVWERYVQIDSPLDIFCS